MECLVHVYLGKILNFTQVYNVVFKLNGTLEHKNEEIFEEISPTVNKRFWLQTILRTIILWKWYN